MSDGTGTRLPLLVVVTGMPSSGKTTVAENLARRVHLPLIAKDDIKEKLYERLGAGDSAWSGRLGDAAYGLIFALGSRALSAGAAVIVEANFFVGQADDFARLPPHRTLQIHCHAPLDVLLDRYASRERHPGHHDAEKIHDLPARYASGEHRPLALGGELVELDTTHPPEPGALVERVRREL